MNNKTVDSRLGDSQKKLGGSVKRLLKAITPYGFIYLSNKRKSKRPAKNIQEQIEKRMQEIRQQHRYVGLHMGCGPIWRAGYLNCDLEGGEFNIDATKPLPIPDDSLDYVYSEHFIEHLAFDEALFFIKESFRVLKKGGIFRSLTPDLSLLLSIADNHLELATKIRQRIVEGVFSEDGVCIQNPRVSPEQAALWDHRDDIIHNFMRDWDHKYLWSAHHLAKAAEHVGFREVEVLPYGVSRDDRACLDPKDRWGWEWTSVVEARK